jgi:hypothetical protein
MVDDLAEALRLLGLLDESLLRTKVYAIVGLVRRDLVRLRGRLP